MADRYDEIYRRSGAILAVNPADTAA